MYNPLPPPQHTHRRKHIHTHTQIQHARFTQSLPHRSARNVARNLVSSSALAKVRSNLSMIAPNHPRRCASSPRSDGVSDALLGLAENLCKARHSPLFFPLRARVDPCMAGLSLESVTRRDLFGESSRPTGQFLLGSTLGPGDHPSARRFLGGGVVR